MSRVLANIAQGNSGNDQEAAYLRLFYVYLTKKEKKGAQVELVGPSPKMALENIYTCCLIRARPLQHFG
jgi:hypothetical protein